MTMIDHENKRRNVAAYTPAAIIAPVPDSAVDAEDRRHMAWIYRGVETIPIVFSTLRRLGTPVDKVPPPVRIW